MRRKFAVLGLGRFGKSVAQTLIDNEAEVIAIDSDMKHIEEIKDIVTIAVKLDSTNKDALLQHSVDKVDVAVVSIGENIENNILTTALLKEMGVKEIIARAMDPLHAKILSLVGATRVVLPEEDMGKRLGNALLAPNLIEVFENELLGKIVVMEYDIIDGIHSIILGLNRLAVGQMDAVVLLQYDTSTQSWSKFELTHFGFARSNVTDI